MSKIIILVAAAIVMQSSVLYAADNNQSEKQGQNKSMPMGARAGMGDMAMMKQNMQKMMKQMKAINTTQDPKKRKQLMHEHMQNMHEGMQMMRSTGGGMMMGMTGDKKGSAGMMGKNMDSKDMSQRHQMMEQRVDMMQMMMEQMMDQMMVQEGVPPKMKKQHDHYKSNK